MQNSNQSIDIIAIISAIIALLSAIFAFWQARIAKRTYKLQEQIYEDGKVNFAIEDIENSFLYDKKGIDKIYYFFKIILSNLSDKPTSISKIQLALSQNNAEALIISCTTDLLIQPELIRLSLPINIEPHCSNTGWVTFEINRELYNSVNIDTHYIIATDIHGVTIKREEITVREEVIDYEL